MGFLKGFWNSLSVFFAGKDDMRDVKLTLALLLLENKLIMATLQEVKDAVAAEAAEVAAKVNELAAEIRALKDALASGTGVTAADLDDLLAAVSNIFTAPPVA